MLEKVGMSYFRVGLRLCVLLGGRRTKNELTLNADIVLQLILPFVLDPRKSIK